MFWRNLTAVVIFVGIMWAAGDPAPVERTISPARERWPVVVIDPRVLPIYVEVSHD